MPRVQISLGLGIRKNLVKFFNVCLLISSHLIKPVCATKRSSHSINKSCRMFSRFFSVAHFFTPVHLTPYLLIPI